jgi:N-acyl-D-aspartate/D-glutamate deacylase
LGVADAAAHIEAVTTALSETTDFFGFGDRGRLKPGLRADINLIDFDRLRLYQPEVLHDLADGGWYSASTATARPSLPARRYSRTAQIPALAPAA